LRGAPARCPLARTHPGPQQYRYSRWAEMRARDAQSSRPTQDSRGIGSVCDGPLMFHALQREDTEPDATGIAPRQVAADKCRRPLAVASRQGDDELLVHRVSGVSSSQSSEARFTCKGSGKFNLPSNGTSSDTSVSYTSATGRSQISKGSSSHRAQGSGGHKGKIGGKGFAAAPFWGRRAVAEPLRRSHTLPALEESIFHKTKFCRFYSIGRCRRGFKCRFAHSREELQETPDLRCTKICPNVLSGQPCLFGDQCTYAHYLGQLRELSRPFTASGSAEAPTGVQSSAAPTTASQAANSRSAICEEVGTWDPPHPQPSETEFLPPTPSSALLSTGHDNSELMSMALRESESTEPSLHTTPVPLPRSAPFSSPQGLRVQNTFLTVAPSESTLQCQNRRASSAPR